MCGGDHDKRRSDAGGPDRGDRLDDCEGAVKFRRDWRYLLNRAWSIKLALLSAVLGAIEISMPLFSEIAPRNIFAVLSMLVAVAAAVVRMLNQPGMDRRHEDQPVLMDRRKEE